MRTNTLALIAVMMMWAPLAGAQHTTPTLGAPNTEAAVPVEGAQPVVDAAEEETIEINVEGLRRAGFVQAVIDALQNAGEEAPTRAGT